MCEYNQWDVTLIMHVNNISLKLFFLKTSEEKLPSNSRVNINYCDVRCRSCIGGKSNLFFKHFNLTYSSHLLFESDEKLKAKFVDKWSECLQTSFLNWLNLLITVNLITSLIKIISQIDEKILSSVIIDVARKYYQLFYIIVRVNFCNIVNWYRFF